MSKLFDWGTGKIASIIVFFCTIVATSVAVLTYLNDKEHISTEITNENSFSKRTTIKVPMKSLPFPTKTGKYSSLEESGIVGLAMGHIITYPNINEAYGKTLQFEFTTSEDITNMFGDAVIKGDIPTLTITAKVSKLYQNNTNLMCYDIDFFVVDANYWTTTRLFHGSKVYTFCKIDQGWRAIDIR